MASSVTLNSTNNSEMKIEYQGTSGVPKTVVVPDVNGEVIVKGTGGVPCFSAKRTTSQVVSSNVVSLVLVDTEEFDTTNAFSTASSVFNPKVSGYYNVTFEVNGKGSTGTNLVEASLTKTGVQVHPSGSFIYNTTAYSSATSTGSAIVYLNGTTDYIGLIARIVGTGTCTVDYAHIQAHLIVGA